MVSGRKVDFRNVNKPAVSLNVRYLIPKTVELTFLDIFLLLAETPCLELMVFKNRVSLL